MLKKLLAISICAITQGCISVNTPQSSSGPLQTDQNSSREISELREEIRSLKEIVSRNQEPISEPNAEESGGIDYVYIETLIRETSMVGGMPNVRFTRPEVYDEYGILEYEVEDGEFKGANGFVFVERSYGSRFNEIQQGGKLACRETGDEVHEVSQLADTDDSFGTMSSVYACITKGDGVQIFARSETLFTLDGGYGIGYFEVVPAGASYEDAIQAIRQEQQSF